MGYLVPVACLLVGLLLGAGATFVVLKVRRAQATGEAKVEADTAIIRLTERLQGREENAQELKNDLTRKDAAISELLARVNKLTALEGQLTATLYQERRSAGEKSALLDEARQKLADAFKALAADCLKASNASFLELAKASLGKYQESAKGDLEKRQQSIEETVKPLRETLAKVDSKLQEIEVSRVGAYEGLMEQVKSLAVTGKELRGETANLVQSLRKPAVRGRWGEIQLKRVVEMSGMLDHCDFYEQRTANTEGGPVRPDMLVRLPGSKNIVVDAKTPLIAFLDALEAPDEAARLAKMKDHARHVRTHMTNLGRRSYFEQFDPTPEFVVLFLPGESFFSAALEHDPELIEFGVTENVILATPTTLIALLRAVSYGWRQEHLAENAKQISNLGKELYKRVCDLGANFGGVGKGLERAIEAYNKSVGTLESRVLVSARKFRDLGAAGTADDVEVLAPVSSSARLLQSPELLPVPDPINLHVGLIGGAVVAGEGTN
ncbi:MAG: hypothetical protein JWN43_3704 [Gammaproteobacteria bacterium]|nr:hypothetical protein [Gammaproteobacteria bacterium]